VTSWVDRRSFIAPMLSRDGPGRAAEPAGDEILTEP